MLRSTIGKISRSLSQEITSVSVPAAPFARVVHQHDPLEYRGRREDRVAAAPGAPAQRKFARAREPQVQAGSARPSLRSGLRLIRALLGEPACCHRRLAKPLELAAKLGAEHGRARTTRLRRPCSRRSSVGAIHVHRIPHHVRDDRDTPLAGAERGPVNHDFRKSETAIFLRAHLERANHLDAACKIRLSVQALFVPRSVLRSRCPKTLPGGQISGASPAAPGPGRDG